MVYSLNLLDTQNFLCVKVTRVITNYASIGEYYLRFFPKENFCCLYGYYPIESRYYIFHKYRRYNNSWNSNKCHISNSKIWPKHVWLQYDIKSLWLFGFICAQNSISSLVLYNRLNSIKSPWLFHFIWVKIHSYLYLFLLPNYILHKITWTLCRVFSFPNLSFYIVFYY